MRALSFLAIVAAISGPVLVGTYLSQSAERPSGLVRTVGADVAAVPSGRAPAGPLTVDGDTFLLAGERYRLAGIDAPEANRPRCEIERGLGLEAKHRLAELLASGTLSIERQGTDVYRQTLARVTVDGRDIGATLVAEGHALPYQRGSAAKLARLGQWCGTTAALESMGRS